MAIPKKLLNYLDKNKIKYEILKHKTAYTAYDKAQTLGTELKKIAKTLVIKADKKYILVVLPAHYRLDFKKLKKIIKAKKISIAPENVMKKYFKVKPGMITPFAGLYKVEVAIDNTLSKLEKSIMQAGSFTESLRLKLKDYLRTERPIRGSFGVKPPKPLKLQIKPIKKKKTKKGSKKTIKKKVVKKRTRKQSKSKKK